MSSSFESLVNFPKVTVIIPVFNAQDTIVRTLNSVYTSKYPDYEVIIVDDGSQDQTVLTLENWCEKTVHSIRLLRKKHGGKASAANFGAKESQGEVLFFLDADSYVVPDFIERSLVILEKTRKDAIDYVQQVSNPQATLWTRVSQFERKLLELHPDNFGALFVVKREVLEKYPFTTCLSPQYDMDMRLSRADLLIFDPTPVVFSDEPVKFMRMLQRKIRWTYGFLEAIKMNGFEKRREKFSFVLRFSLSFIGLFLMVIPFILGLVVNYFFYFFPVLLFVVLMTKNFILAYRMRLNLGIAIIFTLYQLYILNLAVVIAVLRFGFRRPPKW
ncbi:MAG: glycosyltransferase [Candidatus Hodarchaeota archaeon]